MDEHGPSEPVTEDSLTHNALNSAEELTVEVITIDASLETDDMVNNESTDDDTLNKEHGEHRGTTQSTRACTSSLP